MNHPNPRRVVPLLILVALVALGLWWWRGQQATAADGTLRASGTIEARSVTLAAEMTGRVIEVLAEEGDTVTQGQPLVRLDASLLDAQYAQAEAAARATEGQRAAAEANHAAAQANLALLEAGASEEQRTVADSAVDRAKAALEAAQSALDALPEAARTGPQGQPLQQQIALAQATLDNATAQRDQVEAGPRPQQIEAAEAQVAAAEAQVEAITAQAEAARAALDVLKVQQGRATIVAPMDGVVVTRMAEPGALATMGGALLDLADLSSLTLTVYVPEDRYGAIHIGDAATVTVDSFPGQSIAATVQRIADRAEFTPRNVQTSTGRRNTVYAVTLRLDNPDAALKPGMPADVVFGE